MAKQKPKGWNALSKAQQTKWKKDNFDTKIKVTEAQLDKLRAAGTKTAAIAKYKNDPAMREALNRFYGKSAVGAGSGSSTARTGTKQPGGPGEKPRPTRTRPPNSYPQQATTGKEPISKLGGRRYSGAEKRMTKEQRDRAAKMLGTGVAIGSLVIPGAVGARLAYGSYKAGSAAVKLAKVAKSKPRHKKPKHNEPKHKATVKPTVKPKSPGNTWAAKVVSSVTPAQAAAAKKAAKASKDKK